MRKRRFGRTGHDSSIVVFGAFSVGQVDQREADAVLEQVLAHGVNHIDVAPSYSEAELRIGPWLERYPDRFFVGCKTTERERVGARDEMRRSLKRLRIDHFDLYQIHAVLTLEDLDRCFAPGGAMEAIQEARDQGLTRFTGITSHGLGAPAVQIEALRRYDFDSLLFPLNAKLWSDATYRRDCQTLLSMAEERDAGTMVIKAFVRGPWGARPPSFQTWYEPLEGPEWTERALRFVLSQPVSAVISAGDARLLPTILDAAERFEPMEPGEQEALLAQAGEFEPLFT